ncbi:metallophosphoesterase [Synechocystis salina LEGE 00031]|uniref:Metallophosphoesterase n=2 Tax=Synechocystis TaxID=1142 RepID=A0ABR9VNR2_9SYNC|nr:metallophosphoesterase [Synechocystis salina LEGE 00041]MBE9252969.1 metallophosphoesterase [Synechocystis salina LEGE 00031]
MPSKGRGNGRRKVQGELPVRYKTLHFRDFFDDNKLKLRRWAFCFLAIAVFVGIITGSWLTSPGGSVGLGQTLPLRGDLRMAVISDLNSAYGSTSYEPEVHKALELIPNLQPDLVLCSGDMVAGQSPKLTSAQIQAMWDAFDRVVTQPLRQARIPFGFTLGNHDASGALDQNRRFRFQNERELAARYWRNPAHDPGITFLDKSDFPFYYTFSQNGVFFLVWDGSTHRIPPEKLAWVERALASAPAQNAKLRMAIGHLPLYGVAEGRNKPGEVMANAEQLRALLEKYQVHTYISGHQHAYYPGRRGNLELLHTGILGAGPRVLIGQERRSPKTLTILDVTFDQPDQVQYTTYDMKDLSPVGLESLPRFLLGHNGRVIRRDLREANLTPAEQQACGASLGLALCNVR